MHRSLGLFQGFRLLGCPAFLVQTGRRLHLVTFPSLKLSRKVRVSEILFSIRPVSAGMEHLGAIENVSIASDIVGHDTGLQAVLHEQLRVIVGLALEVNACVSAGLLRTDFADRTRTSCRLGCGSLFGNVLVFAS